MKLNAIQYHEVVCSWIESALTEAQLDVCQDVVTGQFTRHFPLADNVLHGQFVTNMLNKIEAKRVTESAHQRFPVNDEHGH